MPPGQSIRRHKTRAASDEPEAYGSVSGKNRADLFILTALILCGSEFGLIRGFTCNVCGDAGGPCYRKSVF